MRIESVETSKTVVHTTLPVSLENLATGRPFAVFECFRNLLWRSIQPSSNPQVEALACRELILSGDKQSSNNLEALSKVVFSTWTLAASQWQANLDYLKDTFRRRRFDALARPGMNTYLPLIHLRQLIVGMRDHLPRAQQNSRLLENGMVAEEPFRLSLPPSGLSKKLTQIAEDIDKLDKELNDEIHLIIGAVTVQDSDANKQQTERATLLTLLAAIYLPLTLVTGIFGMNIREIDQSKTSWQASGEVLAVVAACTIVFVLAYRQWRVWRRGQQEKERMGLGFLKDV
jgi:Mg2+ and Co2+ transporter CorA